MSIKKELINRNVLNKKNVGNNIVSLILTVVGTLIMLYIGIKYIGDKDQTARMYASYAFIMVIFGFLGFLTTDYYEDQKINFKPKLNEFDKYKYLTHTLILFITSAMVEIFMKVSVRLALSDIDFILYNVFAGVCEEAFFRKFLINMIIRLRAKYNQKPDLITIILALIISAFAFMCVHLGVYGSDPIMLISTLIGGFILGVGYIGFRDISANMSAHCLKNTVGAINLVRF